MPGPPTGTVTFLFTDIEGSTRLLQQLGDTRYADVFEALRHLLLSAFTSGGGHVLQDQGESLLAVFPRATEAVMAAVAAQRALKDYRWPVGVGPRVRMGLHTGEPLYTDDGYVGLDVHRAARICHAGHGGQVLISRQTEELIAGHLPDGIALRDLGAHRLKDLQRSENVYQVLHPDLPIDFPPLKSLDHLPNNLPLEITSFVGREGEMADVKRLLSTTRLLTLTGVGGLGKTRLALHVAADMVDAYADGVWLVELAALSDIALVPQAVASALRAREQPGQSLLAALSEYLQPKRLLLILDNCEHVVSGCAQLAHALLTTCPGLHILTTSRQPLGLTGEVVWQVPPLSAPDPRRLPDPGRLTEFEAIRLFTDRATAVQPQFLVTSQNAPLLAGVCYRLDGIPLAIELAAARMRVLSVDQILQRLEDRFRLLTGGSRTAPPRHQTLRAAMDWSYALLEPNEQTLSARLSVFAGGWTMEGAEAVCAGDGIEADEVFNVLARLVDQSLILVDRQDHDVRYRMLETVREYGREKLLESGEAAALHRRHLTWFLDLAERVEALLLGAGEAWLDRLELEHDNLRAALDYAIKNDPGAGLRLAGALRRFWLVRGYWTEGRQWLATLLAADTSADAVRAKALFGAAALAQYQGDYERAAALASESLSLQRKHRDAGGIANCLNTLGNVMLERGDYREAGRLYEESLVCARQANDIHTSASSLVNLANVAAHEGDYARAIALGEEGLALFRTVSDSHGIAFALNLLGVLASDQRDLVTARARFEESLAIRRELGDRRGIAGSLASLGYVARELGDCATAEARYEEGLAIHRDLGDQRGIATSLRNLGQVAWQRGDGVRAASLLGESLVIRRAQGNRSGLADALEGLALVARDPGRTARLFGAATSLREATGSAPLPSDGAAYQKRLGAVRAVLGETVFAAAWEAGRAMTLAQVAQYALTAETSIPA